MGIDKSAKDCQGLFEWQRGGSEEICLKALTVWLAFLLHAFKIILEIDLFQSKKFYNKEILVLPEMNLTDMFYLI